MKTTSELRAGVWLIWVGLGVGASLSSMGYNWIVSQSASFVFYGIYGYHTMNMQLVIRSILFTVLEIFFKDIDIAGAGRVPKSGPVILACAPHANQFVDAIVVLRALAHRKDVGMITAATTVRRQYVGKVARTMGSVPVERPQDVAKVGAGKISYDGLQVKGHKGTKFTTQVKPRDTLMFTSGPFKKSSARVASVENNSEITLEKPFPTNTEQLDTPQPYKVIPYIDQAVVFNSVYEALNAGGCIGIFPEGGSHDRTRLLPLKPGVAIMAVGAMAKHDGLKVPIIPVGINYFRGHQFRSRVFVDVGQPIVPTEDMVENFRQGGVSKREACNELMREVTAGVKGVTIEAEDFHTLQFLRFMRRVYPSRKARPSAIERFAMVKAFSEGYERDQGLTRVAILKENVLEYFQLLKHYDIPDHKVGAIARNSPEHFFLDEFVDRSVNAVTLAYRVGLLCFYAIMAFPGLLLAAPVMIIAAQKSKEEAKKAVAGSSVKIAGRDVIATWKLMVSFVVVPVLHLFYTLVFYLAAGSTVATVYFFFSPMTAGASILAVERANKLFLSVKSLSMAVMDKETGSTLVKTRVNLQREIRSMVRDLAWDDKLNDDDNTKHLFRRFSTKLTLADYDEDWEMNDQFFQLPRERSQSVESN